MNKESIVETLAGICFLQGVSREHLEQIAEFSEIRNYADQSVVFREGEIADGLYLVISGRLSLELSQGTIECKHLVTVGPGEILGWSTLVEQPRFAATAVAAEPTRIVRIDGARLRAICDEDPKFGYEFMRRTTLALAKRLAVTWRELSHVHVSHYLPVTSSAEEASE